MIGIGGGDWKHYVRGKPNVVKRCIKKNEFLIVLGDPTSWHKKSPPIMRPFFGQRVHGLVKPFK